MKLDIVILLMLRGTEILGKNAFPQKIDDILDRIERKLLESKQDELLLSEQWSRPVEIKIKSKLQ